MSASHSPSRPPSADIIWRISSVAREDMTRFSNEYVRVREEAEVR